jgi:hypothetical protein
MSLKLLRTRAVGLCAGLALFAGACASEPSQSHQGGPDDEVAESSQEGAIQAGPASQAAGVARWQAARTGNRALFQGFSASNELITEFQLDNDTRIVESSLPDVGARHLDDGSVDTMSAEASAFVDALASDLEASYNTATLEAASQVDEKVFQACFATLYQCDDLGWYGFFKYWWDAWDCHRYIPPCTGTQYALLTNR